MAQSPRKDGRDRTLGTLTIDDMYTKLLWEAGQFTRMAGRAADPNLPARYMAQNAASTAWHMVDWLAEELHQREYWEDFSRLTGREMSRKADLSAWVRESYAMLACQQIPFAVKHVMLDAHAYEDGIFTDNTFVDFHVEVDAGGVVIGQNRLVHNVVPVHKVIINGTGPMDGVYSLEAVFEAAISFWQDVLATLRSASA